MGHCSAMRGSGLFQASDRCEAMLMRDFSTCSLCQTAYLSVATQARATAGVSAAKKYSFFPAVPMSASGRERIHHHTILMPQNSTQTSAGACSYAGLSAQGLMLLVSLVGGICSDSQKQQPSYCFAPLHEEVRAVGREHAPVKQS